MENHHDPIILIVEGVDCVGKTTLAKAIAEKHGFGYLYTPQTPLATIRKDLEALNDPHTRFMYYLTAVIAVQRAIRSSLDAGRSVVIDRYIYSTLVMHQMLGVDTSYVEIGKLPILWPTVSVLLTANNETRIQRKNEREGQDYDARIEQSTALLSRAQEAFRTACVWSLVVETDNFTQWQVYEEVARHLEEHDHVRRL